MEPTTSAYAHSTAKQYLVNVHVGARMRLRRQILGMSQVALGEAIGVTFQQVQKYEWGKNAISSSRLYDLARVLGVPVGYFFEDMPPSREVNLPAQECLVAKERAGHERDAVAERETLQLVRAYYKISNLEVRRRLLEMVKALGASVEI